MVRSMHTMTAMMLRPRAKVMVVMSQNESACEDAKANARHNSHSGVFLLELVAMPIVANLCMSRSALAEHKQGRYAADRCGRQENNWQHPEAKEMMHVVVGHEAMPVKLAMVEVTTAPEDHDGGDYGEEA